MDPKETTLPPAAFVNLLRVGFNPGEFYLTFAQLAQGSSGGAHLVSSLVTSPARAKAMLSALSESVERYEERFGEIAEHAPDADGAASPEKVERTAAGAAKPPQIKRAARG